VGRRADGLVDLTPDPPLPAPPDLDRPADPADPAAVAQYWVRGCRLPPSNPC